MSKLLLSYFNNRMTENKAVKQKDASIAGPVITISREIGCNGLKLANSVANQLNLINTGVKWTVISKEVFQEGGRELNMDPDRIRKILYQHEKFTFNDILTALNEKNYKTDQTIINTIKKVILQIATEGNCIIVGRAGHIIASNIKNALHVRIIAPLDFRIQAIMNANKLGKEEALRFIQKVDNERLAFRKAISKQDSLNEFFDLTVNRAAFSEDEIIELIEFAAIQKGLI